MAEKRFPINLSSEKKQMLLSSSKFRSWFYKLRLLFMLVKQVPVNIKDFA